MTMHARVCGLLGMVLLGGCALAKNDDSGAATEDDCVIRAVPVFFDSAALTPDGDGMTVDLFIANNHADCVVPQEDWSAFCPHAPATETQPEIPATEDFVSVELPADSVTQVSGRLDLLLEAGESYGCVLFYKGEVADNITIVAP